MIDELRSLIEMHGRLPIPIKALQNTDNLHEIGMASFASVQLMLAIEEHFDVQYSTDMMTMDSFSSVVAIEAGLRQLLSVPAN